MKSSIIRKAAIPALVLLALPEVCAGDWSGNVSGYVGQKMLDDDDWPRVDEQVSSGILFDIRKDSWPVGIAADFIVSGDVEKSGSEKDEAYARELHLGVRKRFDLQDSSFKPYVGGGITWVSAEMKHKEVGVSQSDDDEAFGAWVGGGVNYLVGKHFNVGLDVRYAAAKVNLFDKERQVGGFYSGITAGYSF